MRRLARGSLRRLAFFLVDLFHVACDVEGCHYLFTNLDERYVRKIVLLEHLKLNKDLFAVLRIYI